MARERKIQLMLKRVYEPPARADGCRVLVDAIWPRGLCKESARLDGWIKEVAPSAGLRKWFGHEAPKWEGFKRKDVEHNNAVALKQYLDELRAKQR